MWLPLAVGILFLLMGSLCFLKPQFIWKITESWKSSAGSEPSDLYLLSTRIGGVVMTGIGLYFVIAGIWYWNS